MPSTIIIARRRLTAHDSWGFSVSGADIGRITRVQPDSPFFGALRPGITISSVNGQDTPTGDDVVRSVKSAELTLKLVCEDKHGLVKKHDRIVERPTSSSSWGLKLNRHGLVVSVEPNSPASASGLKEGDAIAEVNGEMISTATDVSRAMKGTTAVKLSVLAKTGVDSSVVGALDSHNSRGGNNSERSLSANSGKKKRHPHHGEGDKDHQQISSSQQPQKQQQIQNQNQNQQQQHHHHHHHHQSISSRPESKSYEKKGDDRQYLSNNNNNNQAGDRFFSSSKGGSAPGISGNEPFRSLARVHNHLAADFGYEVTADLVRLYNEHNQLLQDENSNSNNAGAGAAEKAADKKQLQFLLEPKVLSSMQKFELRMQMFRTGAQRAGPEEWPKIEGWARSQNADSFASLAQTWRNRSRFHGMSSAERDAVFGVPAVSVYPPDVSVLGGNNSLNQFDTLLLPVFTVRNRTKKLQPGGGGGGAMALWAALPFMTYTAGQHNLQGYAPVAAVVAAPASPALNKESTASTTPAADSAAAAAADAAAAAPVDAATPAPESDAKAPADNSSSGDGAASAATTTTTPTATTTTTTATTSEPKIRRETKLPEYKSRSLGFIMEGCDAEEELLQMAVDEATKQSVVVGLKQSADPAEAEAFGFDHVMAGTDLFERTWGVSSEHIDEVIKVEFNHGDQAASSKAVLADTAYVFVVNELRCRRLEKKVACCAPCAMTPPPFVDVQKLVESMSKPATAVASHRALFHYNAHAGMVLSKRKKFLPLTFDHWKGAKIRSVFRR